MNNAKNELIVSSVKPISKAHDIQSIFVLVGVVLYGIGYYMPMVVVDFGLLAVIPHLVLMGVGKFLFLVGAMALLFVRGFIFFYSYGVEHQITLRSIRDRVCRD